MIDACRLQNKCLIAEIANKLQSQRQPELRLAVPFDFPQGITTTEAITALLASKGKANCQDNYVASLKMYVNRFAIGREKKPLQDITSDEIENWLDQFKNSNSRATWLNRINTLFSFGMRKGWIDRNPCDRVERVHIDRRPPAIVTPAQADTLLKLVPSLCRPYLILALFAGIRPDEIRRMDWKHINFETKTVKVDGKTRQRRIVPLEPRAIELLLTCTRFTEGPVAPSLATLVRFKRRARAALGLAKFPQDLLRHSYGSYALALYKDAGVVSTRMGNSNSVLLRHYHEPVSDADARLFWAVGMTKYDSVGLETNVTQEQANTDGTRKAVGPHLTESHPHSQTGIQGLGQEPTAQRELFGGGSVQNAS